MVVGNSYIPDLKYIEWWNLCKSRIQSDRLQLPMESFASVTMRLGTYTFSLNSPSSLFWQPQIQMTAFLNAGVEKRDPSLQTNYQTERFKSVHFLFIPVYTSCDSRGVLIRYYPYIGYKHASPAPPSPLALPPPPAATIATAKTNSSDVHHGFAADT